MAGNIGVTVKPLDIPCQASETSSPKTPMVQKIKHVVNVATRRLQKLSSGVRRGERSTGGMAIRSVAKQNKSAANIQNPADDSLLQTESNTEESQSVTSTSEEQSQSKFELNDFEKKFTQKCRNYTFAKADKSNIDTKKIQADKFHSSVEAFLDRMTAIYYAAYGKLEENPSTDSLKKLNENMQNFFKLLNQDSLDEKSSLNGFQYGKETQSAEFKRLEAELFEITKEILGKDISSVGTFLMKSEVAPFILSYLEQHLGSKLNNDSKDTVMNYIDASALEQFNNLRGGIDSYQTGKVENIGRDIEIVLRLPQLLRGFIAGILAPQEPPAVEILPELPPAVIAAPPQAQRIDDPAGPAGHGRSENTGPQNQQPIIYNDNRQYYDFSNIDNSIFISSNDTITKEGQAKTSRTHGVQTNAAAGSSPTTASTRDNAELEATFAIFNPMKVDNAGQTLRLPGEMHWVDNLIATRDIVSASPMAKPQPPQLASVTSPAKTRPGVNMAPGVKLSNQGLRTANHPQALPAYDHQGRKLPAAADSTTASGLGNSHSSRLAPGGRRVIKTPKDQPALVSGAQKISSDSANAISGAQYLLDARARLKTGGPGPQSPRFNRLNANAGSGSTGPSSLESTDARDWSVKTTPSAITQKITQDFLSDKGSVLGQNGDKMPAAPGLIAAGVIESASPMAKPQLPQLSSVTSPAKTRPGVNTAPGVKLSNQGLRTANHPQALPAYDHQGRKLPAAADSTTASGLGNSHSSRLAFGGQRIIKTPKDQPALVSGGQKISSDAANAISGAQYLLDARARLKTGGSGPQSPRFNRLNANAGSGSTGPSSLESTDARDWSVKTSPSAITQKITQDSLSDKGSVLGQNGDKLPAAPGLIAAGVIESASPMAKPQLPQLASVTSPAKTRPGVNTAPGVKLSNQGLRTANHPQALPAYDHQGRKISQDYDNAPQAADARNNSNLRGLAPQSSRLKEFTSNADIGSTRHSSVEFMAASALKLNSQATRTAEKTKQSLTTGDGANLHDGNNTSQVASTNAVNAEQRSQRAAPAIMANGQSVASSHPAANITNDPTSAENKANPVILTRGGQRTANELRNFPPHKHFFKMQWGNGK